MDSVLTQARIIIKSNAALPACSLTSALHPSFLCISLEDKYLLNSDNHVINFIKKLSCMK